MARNKPYTEIGIKRVPCFRCKVNKSTYQWNICADDNVFRGVCKKCDIELNETVLKFMGFDNWEELIQKYKVKVS